MPKKKRIKKTETSNICPPSTTSFSFKYLDSNHANFTFDRQDANYWKTLIDRLKDLSGLTPLELIENRSSTLRFHKIDWQDKRVSENCFGLPNEEQLVSIPYQFSVSSNKYGRVHGFFIENVFYIVWLDPNHKLYPGK